MLFFFKNIFVNTCDASLAHLHQPSLQICDVQLTGASFFVAFSKPNNLFHFAF